MTNENEQDNGFSPEGMSLENIINALNAENAALTEQFEALKKEVETEKDGRLRAMAETENVRRRAEQEKQNASQYAMSKFAQDMVGIADNFARAIASLPKEGVDPQVKAVIDGIEVTERQMLATLERHGVKMIDTSDGKFDPNWHQAIAEVPAPGKAKGTIVDVVQTGYRIGDRLLRPAMVTVARGDGGAAPGGSVDTQA